MNLIEQIQAVDKALTNDIRKDIHKELEKATLLCDEYTTQIKHYNPGTVHIPSDEQYTFTQLSARHRAYWNQYHRMRYLISKDLMLETCRVDIQSLKVQIQSCILLSINKIEEYLKKYGNQCMVQMIHYVLCDSPVPMKMAEKSDFYKKIYEFQVKAIQKIRKTNLVESLEYELGEHIHLFRENKTFPEVDFLIAGILLGYCREKRIKGERTALYFKSIVDRRMEEDIPQERIIEIMDTLFGEGYLDGFRAGKFRFIFEQD